MNILQGFKKCLKWEKYTFEFYCLIHFKTQNGAFQAKFHEFGSRGIWDTEYPKGWYEKCMGPLEGSAWAVTTLNWIFG